MQQYIRTRCDELDRKYGQQELTLQNLKNKDFIRLQDKKRHLLQSNETNQKTCMVVAKIAAVIAGAMCSSSAGFFASLLTITGFWIIAQVSVNKVFLNKKGIIELDIQRELDSREKQVLQEIQQLNVQKGKERKQIEADINQRMNQYLTSFKQNRACKYLVEWIINALSSAIKNADRSTWLPQVRASLRFCVEYGYVEVPGFGKYDMAGQYIHIDSNPMAIGALAYMLEKETLVEAKKRFSIDPNGGRAIFTSTRDDACVEIMYSAPNGNAQTALR